MYIIVIQPLFAPDLAAMRQLAGPRVLFAVCQGVSDIESWMGLRPGRYVQLPTAKSNFLRTYTYFVY